MSVYSALLFHTLHGTNEEFRSLKQSASVACRFDDFYFLTDPEDFIVSHFPDEEKWQLLDTPIPLDEFEKRVFKTSTFYSLGLTLLQPKYYRMVTGRKPRDRDSTQ